MPKQIPDRHQDYRQNVEIFKLLLWMQLMLLKFVLVFAGLALLDLG